MPPSNTSTGWANRTIYLEAVPWRVLRQLLKAEKPIPFHEARPWQRRDKDVALMARLVELGLLTITKEVDGEPYYQITAKGRAAADLGEVVMNAPATPTKGSRSKTG